MRHAQRLALVGLGLRQLFIAYPGFTEPGVECAKELLPLRTVVLGELHELVLVLNARADLTEYLKKKVTAAVLHKHINFKPPL